MKSTNVIKSFRAKRNISQEQVAKLLGITRQTYNSFENNLLKYDCIILFKLLDILELNDMETNEFFDVLKQDYMSYINNDHDRQ